MTSQLARELHEYVRDRAEVEGVGYALSVEFFDDCLNAGVRRFFGVKVERGKIVSDEEERGSGRMMPDRPSAEADGKGNLYRPADS